MTFGCSRLRSAFLFVESLSNEKTKNSFCVYLHTIKCMLLLTRKITKGEIKMLKTLVEEVTFGKAIARITVTMFTEKKYLDGVDINQENVITTSKVEIVVNGKVVESGYSADVLEFNELTSTYFNKNKLDVTKKYTRVGNKAMTVGAETGNLINDTIKEMTAVLSKEFNVETEAEKQQKEEIE